MSSARSAGLTIFCGTANLAVSAVIRTDRHGAPSIQQGAIDRAGMAEAGASKSLLESRRSTGDVSGYAHHGLVARATKDGTGSLSTQSFPGSLRFTPRPAGTDQVVRRGQVSDEVGIPPEIRERAPSGCRDQPADGRDRHCDMRGRALRKGRGRTRSWGGGGHPADCIRGGFVHNRRLAFSFAFLGTRKA